MNPRRVVLTWLATSDGGAERSVPQLAAEISRQSGIQSDVVTLDWSNAVEGGRDDGKRVTTAAAYRERLAGLLARDPTGTVLISNHRTAAVDLTVADTFSVPALAVLRGIAVPGKRVRTLDPGTMTLVKTGWTDLGRQTTGVHRWVGISRAGSRSLCAADPSFGDVAVVYNGVGIPETWRHTDGAARATTPNFLVAARAERWKQLDLALRAFALIHREVPAATMKVLTAGPEERNLREMAARLGGSPVTVERWMPDIGTELVGAHALVHPAAAEGFGRVVAEALARARVAVVADTGGASELVEPGVCGFHFRAGSAESLADAMFRVYSSSHDAMADMEVSARKRAETEFAVGRTASGYLDLCREAQLNARRS